MKETKQSDLNVTLHVAAGISYNHKGPLIFYKNPLEEAEGSYKPRKPRKSSVQTQEEYECIVKEWETERLSKADLRPRGNVMNQPIYCAEVLPHHIQQIQWLQKRHKHQFIFQEDNDPSHGTRNPDSLPARLKGNAHIKTLIHPAQSPDLNPIESIWQIIRQRLRGGSWQTTAEFRAAIEREWRRVSRAQVRRRISDMPRRCQQLVNTKGESIRTRLW
jgi:hypothetical protein